MNTQTRLIYVVQSASADAPADQRRWTDFYENKSQIIAGGVGMTAQRDDSTCIFRLVKRRIIEEVLSGPDEQP